VKDKKTAEALKPWYRYFCKRPTFNDEYLPAFNNPKVTLVDTSAHGGVDRITERGVVYDGVEYGVDCIIFATGFEVGTACTRRARFEIYGRSGKTLTEHWTGGLKTLHGFYSSGFPNCFHMGITQNGLTANFPHMLEEQARHIAEVVRHAKQMEARSLEPTAAAEAAWVGIIRERARSVGSSSRNVRLDTTTMKENRPRAWGFWASNTAADHSSSTTSFASGDQMDRCRVYC
jgi:cation diffusion facilitator CzcD-associated flavoprotein CzcO